MLSLRHISAFVVALLCICSFIANAAAKELPEYCGKTGAPALANFLHWDCSALSVTSISELEQLVKKTYVALDSPATTGTYYETSLPHYSVWMFFAGNKAARFRALFDQDTYGGIGITTFCSDTPKSCAQFQATMASDIPRQFFFKLAPPPPEAPVIYH